MITYNVVEGGPSPLSVKGGRVKINKKCRLGAKSFRITKKKHRAYLFSHFLTNVEKPDSVMKTKSFLLGKEKKEKAEYLTIFTFCRMTLKMPTQSYKNVHQVKEKSLAIFHSDILPTDTEKMPTHLYENFTSLQKKKKSR